MTSQINPSSIDITYPIAGQDNDSQGFRTNFKNIQTGLETARSEITVLQNSIVNPATIANVATSGAYSDLIGKPTLSTVSATGLYTDLIGAPVLANVATSGSYVDLTGKPTLANVATSGSYVDLTGKPTLVTTLDGLTDVTITSVSNNDMLYYDADIVQWVNRKPAIPYTVTVANNGHGGVSVINFNGIALKDSSGVAGVTHPITFKSGERYRFDVSGFDTGSVSPAKFAFSTLVDGGLPATFSVATANEYTTGITRVGTSGTAGAYIDFVPTDSTPTLYAYAISNNPNDVLGWGRSVPFLTYSASGEAVQYVTPADGDTIRIVTGATTLIVNANVATTTIQMPEGPANGTAVTIGFTGNIPTVNWMTVSTTINSPIGNTNAGTFGKWVYSTAGSGWFRIG
jgi:hypothetical protein